MKATCEVVVERQALLTAVAFDGKANELMYPDDVEIGPCGRGLWIETASLDAELEAVGVWSNLVLSSRCLIEEVLQRTSRATVTLIFYGNTLFIDRINLPAEDLGAEEPFHSQRSRRPRRGRKEHQPLLFPLESADRVRCAGPQLPATGLPLFKA